MVVQRLKNIQKETSEEGDVFLDLAGRKDYKYKILSGLKIGIDSKSQPRLPSIKKPYLEVMPDMNIDRNYSGFYHSDNSENEKYYSLTEALTAYNSSIISNSQNKEQAQKYLIYNVPSESEELQLNSIRKEGYSKDNLETVIILNLAPSTKNLDKFDVLMFYNGKYGIVKDVSKRKNGELDLLDVEREDFETQDLQEALDVFSEQTQCRIQEGTEKTKIEHKEEAEPEVLLDEIAMQIERYQKQNDLWQNKKLLFSTPVIPDSSNKDDVVVPLREVSITDYIAFNGRNSAKEKPPIETGNFQDILVSKERFNQLLENTLSYRGAVKNNTLELDLDYEQLRKMLSKAQEFRKSKEVNTAVYTATSIGDGLRESGLMETELDKIMGEVISSEERSDEIKVKDDE